jgi:hypothetical protein
MNAMEGMRGDFRQWRRLRAFRLRQQGWRRRDVALALDVSEVAVGHWLSLARSGGTQALLSHPIPGRPPALSPIQRQMIPEFLWHGPEAYGFRGSLWTCARVGNPTFAPNLDSRNFCDDFPLSRTCQRGFGAGDWCSADLPS